MVGPDDIEKFWTWWATAEERLDEALRDPNGHGTAVDEIRFRLGKIDLAGDVLNQGERHLIVGSAAGFPERRLLAAHWLTGVPDSSRFHFATHHPAEPIERLMASTLNGKPPIAIAELRFAYSWRRTDDRADVTVIFPKGTPGHHAERIATTVLNSALGELEAEAWLGKITVATKPVDGSIDLAALLGQLTPEITARSEPRWEQYIYEKPGAPPLTVLLRQPIQPARHPFLDSCIEITTHLISDAPDEPERMRSQILDGIPGDVLLVAAILTAGRQNTVIYANGRSPSITMLRERAAMLGSEIRAAYDPGWLRVRRFQQIDPAAG
jgi:hypothetical protein